MALVHEQLHRSPDLSRINFGEYVRSLTASLFSSYGIDSTRISLVSQVADVFLPIDVAVPCGLMLQELVSNSIKHAFPGGRSGEIRIAMSPVSYGSSAGLRRGGSGWLLTVRDNGIGLPGEASLETANSLGLRLVRVLTEQLNGRVECLRRGGAEFRIRFRTDSSAESG
jgi:two-component sensor histidine kinase